MNNSQSFKRLAVMLPLSGQPFNRLVCPQVQTLKSESRRFELPLFRHSHCGIQAVSGARMAVKVYRRFAAIADVHVRPPMQVFCSPCVTSKVRCKRLKSQVFAPSRRNPVKETLPIFTLKTPVWLFLAVAFAVEPFQRGVSERKSIA